MGMVNKENLSLMKHTQKKMWMVAYLCETEPRWVCARDICSDLCIMGKFSYKIIRACLETV